MNYRWLADLQDPRILTLGVAALVWSGWYLYRAVLRPRALRSGAACGACGYAITSPITARCPECGGDFAEVGLATAALAARLRGSAASIALVWVVFCTLLAFPVRGIIEGVLMGVLPHYRTVDFDGTTIGGLSGQSMSYWMRVYGSTQRRSDEPFARRGFIGVNLGTNGLGLTPPSGTVETVYFHLDTGQVEQFSGGTRTFQGVALSEASSEAMVARLDPALPKDMVVAHAAALRGIPEWVAKSPESPQDGVNRAYRAVGLEPVSIVIGMLRSGEVAAAKIPGIGVVEAGTLAWIPIGALTLAGAILVARRHRKLTRAMRAVPAST